MGLTQLLLLQLPPGLCQGVPKAPGSCPGLRSSRVRAGVAVPALSRAGLCATSTTPVCVYLLTGIYPQEDPEHFLGLFYRAALWLFDI